MSNRARGRPRKYSEYDALLKSLPKVMSKRPQYLNGIGVFRGVRGDTAWLKLRLRNGGTWKKRHFPPGSSIEIKLGKLSSWTWEQLITKRDELQGRADRGEKLEDQEPVTFEAFAQEWLKQAKHRVKDHLSLKIHVNKHLAPFFGKKQLDQISTIDIDQWTAGQLERLAPGTVKRQLNTLKAIFNNAVRAKLLDSNPCQHTQPIRGIVPRQRFLSLEELKMLLASAEITAEWLPDFITWLVHSGMRRGEALALEWNDVSPLADNRTVISVRTSKTDHPRFVSCTKTMCEILERQKQRSKADTDAVFPIALITLKRKWEQARAGAGLPDVTVHDLRRTHSTHAAAAGIDLRTLAGRIGHSNLSMLQRHYAAFLDSASNDAATTIEGIFRAR